MKRLLNSCPDSEVKPKASRNRQVMSEAVVVKLVFINEFRMFVWMGRRALGEQEDREVME